MVRIVGHVSDVEGNKLEKILKRVFPSVVKKIKVFGQEFVYKNNNIDLEIKSYDGEEFFVNVHYNGLISNAKKFLHTILNDLYDMKAEFDVQFYEIDENADMVSEKTKHTSHSMNSYLPFEA